MAKLSMICLQLTGNLLTEPNWGLLLGTWNSAVMVGIVVCTILPVPCAIDVCIICPPFRKVEKEVCFGVLVMLQKGATRSQVPTS